MWFATFRNYGAKSITTIRIERQADSVSAPHEQNIAPGAITGGLFVEVGSVLTDIARSPSGTEDQDRAILGQVVSMVDKLQKGHTGMKLAVDLFTALASSSAVRTGHLRLQNGCFGCKDRGGLSCSIVQIASQIRPAFLFGKTPANVQPFPAQCSHRSWRDPIGLEADFTSVLRRRADRIQPSSQFPENRGKLVRSPAIVWQEQSTADFGMEAGTAIPV